MLLWYQGDGTDTEIMYTVCAGIIYRIMLLCILIKDLVLHTQRKTCGIKKMYDCGVVSVTKLSVFSKAFFLFFACFFFLQGNEYPLGVCKGSTYYITVHIPDIECDRCYLRLVNILLDSADSK